MVMMTQCVGEVRKAAIELDKALKIYDKKISTISQE
jgi:hypothetical protein